MAPRLESKNDLQLPRKIFHFTGVLGMLMCIIFLPPWMCWVLYSLIAVPMILIDIIRMHIPWLNRIFLKYVGPVLRDSEAKQVSGAAYALIGYHTASSSEEVITTGASRTTVAGVLPCSSAAE